MTTETMPHYDVGDLVYLADIPGQCSHCGEHTDAPMGAIVELGIYKSNLVTLIDRSHTGPLTQGCFPTERLVCSGDELRPVGRELDGIVHASPEDVAAAIAAGWLPPGAEFYGCEFRIVQPRTRRHQ